VLSDELRTHARITRDLIWIGAVSRAKSGTPNAGRRPSENTAELGEKDGHRRARRTRPPERNDNSRKGPQG